jgi:hypothetical protein
LDLRGPGRPSLWIPNLKGPPGKDPMLHRLRVIRKYQHNDNSGIIPVYSNYVAPVLFVYIRTILL